MFTNEFDSESTVTTVMDETAQVEDVELTISDFGVSIRQYSNDDKRVDYIIMSHKMFKDMMSAMNQPVGFFTTKYTKDT